MMVSDLCSSELINKKTKITILLHKKESSMLSITKFVATKLAIIKAVRTIIITNILTVAAIVRDRFTSFRLVNAGT